MNCLKTISIEKEFGTNRLWLSSILLTIFFFLLFYTILRTLTNHVPLHDLGVSFLILSWISVFPIHVVLHCLPLWITRKKSNFGFTNKSWPFLYFSMNEPISKNIALFTLLAPSIFFTGLAIFSAFLYPQYLQYIAMMASINIGISIVDFVKAKHIRLAPKSCLIEEYRESYYVLKQEL